MTLSSSCWTSRVRAGTSGAALSASMRRRSSCRPAALRHCPTSSCRKRASRARSASCAFRTLSAVLRNSCSKLSATLISRAVPPARASSAPSSRTGKWMIEKNQRGSGALAEYQRFAAEYPLDAVPPGVVLGGGKHFEQCGAPVRPAGGFPNSGRELPNTRTKWRCLSSSQEQPGPCSSNSSHSHPACGEFSMTGKCQSRAMRRPRAPVGPCKIRTLPRIKNNLTRSTE